MNRAKEPRGFTLIEMVLVLGLLALLVAIVIPNTVGFLRRGEAGAYNADKKLLQVATDAFYADESNKSAGVRQYPTNNGTGSNTPGTNVYISMPRLVNTNLIPSAPASASSANIGGGTGNYAWYVDASGRVQSNPAYAAGTYP